MNSLTVYYCVFTKVRDCRPKEISVLSLFAFLILSWFFRRPGFMPGWADLPVFKPGYIGNIVPTYIVIALMYLIPLEPECCTKENGKNHMH